jgi:hypothetical protein
MVQRYNMAASHLAQMLPDPEGYWVYYENYAAAIMAAEASRNLIKQLKDQRAALQAENERLRKAGDGLMFEGETMAHEVSWNPAPWDRVVAAWVAAKEGGAK